MPLPGGVIVEVISESQDAYQRAALIDRSICREAAWRVARWLRWAGLLVFPKMRRPPVIN